MYKYNKKQDEITDTSEKGKTGIPSVMKKSFEQSSGFSFDDVRVHYSSEKPAQLHAHAYTQGNDVFVAPGQEKHLPHELGHVVQQKSNMVKPNEEIGGLPLNTDPAMEHDADDIAQNAEENMLFSADTDDVPLQAKAIDGVVQMASQETYNLWAGPLSTIVSGVGLLGALGGFLYTKNKDRKHNYVEDMEKDADAAEEARDEAETAYYETLNVGETEKKGKAIETRKAALKAVRFAKNVRFKYRASKPEGLNRLPILGDNPQKSQNAVYAVKRANEAEVEAKRFANNANDTAAGQENNLNFEPANHENMAEYNNNENILNGLEDTNPPPPVQEQPIEGNEEAIELEDLSEEEENEDQE